MEKQIRRRIRGRKEERKQKEKKVCVWGEGGQQKAN